MALLSEYLRRMEKNLVGLDEKERKMALKEAKIEIIKISKEYGGGEEGIKKAIEEIGSPEKIAKIYSEKYSLGLQDYLIISLISLGLSIFTLPLIPFTTTPNIASLFIIIILGLFIIYIGINWGMKAALVPSIFSAISRSSIFHITLWMYPSALSYDMKGVIAFHLASVILIMMVLAFPIPGRE